MQYLVCHEVQDYPLGMLSDLQLSLLQYVLDTVCKRAVRLHWRHLVGPAVPTYAVLRPALPSAADRSSTAGWLCRGTPCLSHTLPALLERES